MELRSGRKKTPVAVTQHKLAHTDHGISKDSSHLLSIFPQEVWLMTVKHLRTTEDYQNLFNSSTHFPTLLKPERTRLLFASVSKVMLNRYINRGPKFGWNFRSLLKFRLVCSTWKHAIDKLLENLEFYQLFTFEKLASRESYQEVLYNLMKNFDSVESFSNFNSRFEGSRANPFLTRAIKITMPTDQPDLAHFYTWLFSFLREHGTKIWYCEIVMNVEQIWELVHFYHKLKKILKLLPNLKVFQYCSHTMFKLSIGATEIIEAATVVKPVPRMENLRIFVQNGLPYPIVRSLLQNNPQITKIEARHYLTGAHVKTYLELPTNTTELSLLIKDPVQFQSFETAISRSRITRLYVNFQFMDISLESIFIALENQFGNTLEELYVSLPRILLRTVPERDLVLPKLKVLHIWTYRAIELDFILPLRRTLEKLSVIVSDFVVYALVEWREREIILYRHRNQIWRSNIWRMFDKLKMVTMLVNVERTCTCTREQWERSIEVVTISD